MSLRRLTRKTLPAPRLPPAAPAAAAQDHGAPAGHGGAAHTETPPGQAWADKASGGRRTRTRLRGPAARPLRHDRPRPEKLPDEHGDFKDICKVIEKDFEQLNWKLRATCARRPSGSRACAIPTERALPPLSPAADKNIFSLGSLRSGWGRLLHPVGGRGRRAPRGEGVGVLGTCSSASGRPLRGCLAPRPLGGGH